MSCTCVKRRLFWHVRKLCKILKANSCLLIVQLQLWWQMLRTVAFYSITEVSCGQRDAFFSLYVFYSYGKERTHT